MESINITDITQELKQRRIDSIKKEQEKRNAEIQNKEQKVKKEITDIIKKDIIKQIELEEKQEKLKKYYDIVKEEERKKREQEDKEKFLNQCKSIIDYENSYIFRIIFKILVWMFILYTIYYYFKSLIV